MVDNFYAHDRPQHPTLREDRPRGGPRAPVRHKGVLGTAISAMIVVLWVLSGIWLFP
jgi:hypothetical protein